MEQDRIATMRGGMSAGHATLEYPLECGTPAWAHAKCTASGWEWRLPTGEWIHERTYEAAAMQVLQRLEAQGVRAPELQQEIEKPNSLQAACAIGVLLIGAAGLFMLVLMAAGCSVS